MRVFLLQVLMGAALAAQVPQCGPTPVYSRCELVFEMNAQEQAANTNPYATARLQVEFRSPRHRTQMVPSFWNGGGQLVVRFAPMDEGSWTYKISSNIKRFDSQEGQFAATGAQANGFVIPANGHHW